MSLADWSPDGRFITFGLTVLTSWSDCKTIKQNISKKLVANRLVYAMHVYGCEVQLLEILHYHCVMYGSRVAGKPK